MFYDKKRLCSVYFLKYGKKDTRKQKYFIELDKMAHGIK